MTTSVAAPAGTPTGGGGPAAAWFHGWWIVAGLAITQMVGYGVPLCWSARGCG